MDLSFLSLTSKTFFFGVAIMGGNPSFFFREQRCNCMYNAKVPLFFLKFMLNLACMLKPGSSVVIKLLLNYFFVDAL